MKKLQEGIFNNKDLAEWFGCSSSYFSQVKDKKLEQLKAYADFELIGNKQKKIKINRVYEDQYHKKGSYAYQTIRDKFDQTWSDNGLDSCKRVCYQIMETTDLGVVQRTAYNYTLKTRNDLFGKPFQEGGKLGSCKYLWCKQDEDGKLRFLTKEEEQIKSKMIKKYFGDAEQKQIIVQGMIEAGEITKEEAWDILTQMTNMKGNNFLLFLKQLQRTIGCRVIRGTLVQRNLIEQESAF